MGGALHTLLEGRGEHVETFRIAVMVAGEKEASADMPGNQAVPLIVDVPGTGTPTERLARMSGAVRAARSINPRPVTPPPCRRLLLRFLAATGLYRLYMRHQHRLHTLVSNVHGPDRPLTLNGGADRRDHPDRRSAEAGNLTVNVTALSYAGTFTVTISVDPDQVPDLPVLATALQAELDSLITAPPGRLTAVGGLSPLTSRPSRAGHISSQACSAGSNTRLRVRNRTPSGASTLKPAPRPGTTSTRSCVCLQSANCDPEIHTGVSASSNPSLLAAASSALGSSRRTPSRTSARPR